MPVNYDSIANVYDSLSRLIYGKHIVDAQVDLLKYIPKGSKVLIVGGGTGWILESIAELHSQGLEIDYVESSAKMLLLSQKKNCKGNIVNFIHKQIETCILSKQYDVIITPFLFDNFTGEAIDIAFQKMDESLVGKGLWLYVDFVSKEEQNALWQKFLLKMMYLFFGLISNVEIGELINMEPYFSKSYQKEYEAKYFQKFIRSAVYRKQ
jgi:ubiquinone/menaquinone biosynthesis C-methylase UbiE